MQSHQQIYQKKNKSSAEKNSFNQLQDYKKEIIRQESYKILRETIGPKSIDNKGEKLAAKSSKKTNRFLYSEQPKGMLQ